MAKQKEAWDKLSMRDRALFIRLGVLNGIYDIRAIKGVYNEYHNEDSKENHDYNMAAAIATGFGPDQNKHWPDTFKKSNHPTFSVESIYSTKETPGGTWGPNFKTFEPSDWMINTYGSTPTIEYLLKYDPEVTPVYMGGVLLPEITVTANRFNNGGTLAHKYDGELILEDLKMAFLQDWAYRYNNEAPTDTTAVVNAHNSVPLTIDDSILKQGIGGKYNPDTGVTLGRDTFNDIYAHEFSHALRSKIAGGLNNTTKENKELLNQAYPRFTVPLEKIIPSVITTEQLATNTEYRSEISKRAGNLWGKELDTYIDNMSQAELLAGVGTNGYIFGQNVPFTRTSYIGREATRKLLEEYKSLLDITDEQKLKEWYGYTLEDRNNRIKELELAFESGFTEEDRQQAEALRKALKTIAYNTTNPFEVSNNTYLAAFGGPLAHKKSGEKLGNENYADMKSGDTTTEINNNITLAQLAVDYIHSYYNSDGFKARRKQYNWQKGEPRRIHRRMDRTTIPINYVQGGGDKSLYDYHRNEINVGLNPNPSMAGLEQYTIPVAETAAHEVTHAYDYPKTNIYGESIAYDDSYKERGYYSSFPSELYNKYFTNLPEWTSAYRRKLDELYADLGGLRAMIYLATGYDSRLVDDKGNPIPISDELWNAFKQTDYYKNNRFIKTHGDERSRLALLEIAQNNSSSSFLRLDGTYLAALGGPLNHKKSGEELGESSYLNKVKQSEYPILYNLLSSSRGDAKPRFMNTLGFMFNWMDKDPAIYTGNYYFGDRLGYGTKKQVPLDRNIVNLYLNGDETGFEKLDAKPIVVNGDTLLHSQYKGNILPHDTIYLHSSVKPVVEDYIQSKQLLPINNSFGSYKHTNFFDYPYNLEKYKGTTIDDANRASISFKQNTDGSYYMDVFDLWDLNGTDKNKIGIGIEKKLTSDSIDTNGPFILRLNIPIVFSEDTIGESNFLNKISGGKWKDDTVLYSTGGPLYPFSFEKNPFLKTPIVRY